jgi:hypothetical protein
MTRPEHTEHYIFKDSKTIVLDRGFERDSAPGRSPVELERITAHCAVRALASLCEGLIRPMTFGVTRQWVDKEYGLLVGGDGKPPRWNWFLKTPQSPPDADSVYVDPQVMETATLDERSMLAAVDRVLDDPCTAPEGDHLAWDELRMDHTWARLPEPDRHTENDELRIDDYDNQLHRVPIPLERAHGHIWVTKATVWYPFLLGGDQQVRHEVPRRARLRRNHRDDDQRQLVLLVEPRSGQSHARPSSEPPHSARVARRIPAAQHTQ